MKLIKIIGHLLIFLFLTALTQVGGIIWCITCFVSYKYSKRKRIVFPLIYLVFNLMIVPPIAKFLGRERLPVLNSQLRPRNITYPLLFRNYVKPELNDLLKNTAKRLTTYDITITYLDANFPFLDGFPLLPHLSHNDGKKIDISFMYMTNKGNKTNKKPSVSGYGIYVEKENPTANDCINKGYLQYDFTKYLSLENKSNLKFDPENTKTLILELLKAANSEKLFIEPYLKDQLGLNAYSKIRFHGCQAVRHDDHIHFQIK
ncbi:hypothetical protein [Aestuariivivens insulae]|uniref:hypothetical protein n=1 Tax=Aestuariivivens insulae TaxID=1621988 RepID=UPI001F585959|nr:hypothetical protein [Aestuariivivens insulae]